MNETYTNEIHPEMLKPVGVSMEDALKDLLNRQG